MWFYTNVTREEFEKVKDRIQEIMVGLGACESDITLPYQQKTTSVSASGIDTCISDRLVFRFRNEYCRVDEVLYPEKPFIVIEFGLEEDVLRDTMEDAEPFPYDLPDDELVKEVKYSLDIEPYPQS
jgi:hypothetical protein